MATVTRPGTPLPDPTDDMLAEQVRDWMNNVLAFLEGQNIDQNNVDTSSTDGIMALGVTQTSTGKKSFASTAAAGSGPVEVMRIGWAPASGTVAAADGVQVTFYAPDAGGTSGDRASLRVLLEDASAGAVNAYFSAWVDIADTQTEVLTLGKAYPLLDLTPPARSLCTLTWTSFSVARMETGGAQTFSGGIATTAAGLWLDAPNLALGGGTLTQSATLYIAGAPSGALKDYALLVDAGVTGLPGTYDEALVLNGCYVWFNSADSKLYGKEGVPTSATDGTVIATI